MNNFDINLQTLLNLKNFLVFYVSTFLENYKYKACIEAETGLQNNKGE